MPSRRSSRRITRAGTGMVAEDAHLKLGSSRSGPMLRQLDAQLLSGGSGLLGGNGIYRINYVVIIGREHSSPSWSINTVAFDHCPGLMFYASFHHIHFELAEGSQCSRQLAVEVG